MEKNKYITVTQLNKYIKYKIDNDPNLGIVFLKGEISNFKSHTRGHLYFTIKDDNSRINAIMFQGNANKLKFKPTDGMKVLITGRVNVYETSGTYQINVESMLEDGVGSLYLAFEQLKEKLEKEGLFKLEHKKPIPKIPKNIGIITAPTGAAIKDILSTIKRRFPMVNTILFPCLVQGEYAANDIASKIKNANNYDLDVLIIGRGGGSFEDLWPFNEEVVARAIYNSKIPTISAVGHEIDYSIADFVADKRAPTPTGAAEMAVPNKQDILKYLNQITIRLNKSINTKFKVYKQNLINLQNSQIFTNPYRMYEIKEQMFDILYEKLRKEISLFMQSKSEQVNLLKSSFIDKNPSILISDKLYAYNDLVQKIKTSIKNLLKDKNNNYLNLLNKVEILNPITTIKRGYSIVKIDNKTITSIKNIDKGKIIINQLQDGYIESEVIKTYE